MPAAPLLDYAAAGVAVRDDLREAHRALLASFARPGAWLTGAERIAVARESRHAPRCSLCRERAEALSAAQVRGAHERSGGGPGLSEALVEVSHRVRTDSGRLSRDWFERCRDACGGHGPYVETVGIVALMAGLDAFCRALGLDPFELPAPEPGEPSRRHPEGLREGIAWVPLLAPEDASGPEADLYQGGTAIPNIARALSFVPDHVRALVSLTRTHYLALSDMADPRAGRAIDRPQIELVAARVSALNECFY